MEEFKTLTAAYVRTQGERTCLLASAAFLYSVLEKIYSWHAKGDPHVKPKQFAYVYRPELRMDLIIQALKDHGFEAEANKDDNTILVW